MYVDVLNFDKINKITIPELGKKRGRRKYKYGAFLIFRNGVNGHCQKLKDSFKKIKNTNLLLFSILV